MKKKLLASVGLVMTLWKCARKPKLSTAAIDMKHCVAARVVELGLTSEVGHLFAEASDTSVAMIVRPMSIVRVLDVESTQNLPNGIRLRLADVCETITSQMDTIPDWFPVPDTEAEFPFSAFGGGPDTRRHTRKPRKARKVISKDNGAGKKANTKVRKARAKAKTSFKVSRLIRKKVPPPVTESEAIKCVPDNFRRNSTGRQLIKETMQRLHAKDSKENAKNPAFDSDGKCRLKVAECSGVTWTDILARSPEYFMRKFLVSRSFMYPQATELI